ncbi:MAG: hypothetical protein J3Q66DRAFT_392895 [Benniella sp.]|nr:MAG: hypothetical protein J3Q66DRAFT_392895 [Benniella sp.]
MTSNNNVAGSSTAAMEGIATIAQPRPLPSNPLLGTRQLLSSSGTVFELKEGPDTVEAFHGLISLQRVNAVSPLAAEDPAVLSLIHQFSASVLQGSPVPDAVKSPTTLFDEFGRLASLAGAAPLPESHHLPAFKKVGVTLDQSFALLDKYLKRASVILQKMRQAEKVIASLKTLPANSKYFGTWNFAGTCPQLSQPAKDSFHSMCVQILRKSILEDKERVAASCASQLESGLLRELMEELAIYSTNIGARQGLDEGTRNHLQHCVKNTASQFLAGVRVLMTNNVVSHFDLEVKKKIDKQKQTSKPAPPSKKGKGKVPPSSPPKKKQGKASPQKTGSKQQPSSKGKDKLRQVAGKKNFKKTK